MDRTLRRRRGELEERWLAGVRDSVPGAASRAVVASSWQRSSRTVAADLPVAPVVPSEDVVARWSDSRVGRASRLILDDLGDLVAQGNLVAAITDEEVTIAWAAGGRQMARRAEQVHFAPGGRWAEDAVGTNALALARLTGKPETVFSAEHFAPMVHDWVCYSAPILDPHTGTFLGVIDVSTIWSRANPALLTTVSALARCVEYELASDRRPLGAGAGALRHRGAVGAGDAPGGPGPAGPRGRRRGGRRRHRPRLAPPVRAAGHPRPPPRGSLARRADLLRPRGPSRAARHGQGGAVPSAQPARRSHRLPPLPPRRAGHRRRGRAGRRAGDR